MYNSSSTTSELIIALIGGLLLKKTILPGDEPQAKN